MRGSECPVRRIPLGTLLLWLDPNGTAISCIEFAAVEMPDVDHYPRVDELEINRECRVRYRGASGIFDPKHPDGGTIFVPRDGLDYFLRELK